MSEHKWTREIMWANSDMLTKVCPGDPADAEKRPEICTDALTEIVRKPTFVRIKCDGIVVHEYDCLRDKHTDIVIAKDEPCPAPAELIVFRGCVKRLWLCEAHRGNYTGGGKVATYGDEDDPTTEFGGPLRRCGETME